jgi:hypothetical protein
LSEGDLLVTRANDEIKGEKIVVPVSK